MPEPLRSLVRSPPARHRVRRRRMATVALLVAAGCISYADRTAFSLGSTAIMAEMHISYTVMGLLMSAFSWAYLVGQIPTGLLADRIRPRVLLGAGLVFWSCAQIASGLAGSVAGLMLARVGLGLGEAPLFLSGTRALVLWFSPEERGRPIGLFNSAAALGPAIAPPILLAVMSVAGWRGMLVAAGLASLALGAAWVAYYRDPSRAERGGEDAQSPSPPPAASVLRAMLAELGALFSRKSTWAITTGYAGVIYLTWLFATWMPVWLERTHHLSATQAGLLSSLPQFCGFVGSIAGGAASDRLTARGVDPVDSCRYLITVAMLLASAATALAVLNLSLTATIALVGAALFFGGVAMTCGWTLGTLITPEHSVATLEAVQNTGASVGGALAPAITGLLAQRFDSFTPPLLVAALIGLTSAAIYLLALRGDAPHAPSRAHT